MDFSDSVLRLKYFVSELRLVSPGGGLRGQMVNNLRYMFKIVGNRVGNGVYGFDSSSLGKVNDLEGFVSSLPVTDPRHYVENMDAYNKWLVEGGSLASDVVLTSGTSGGPKIVTYSRYDSFRDLLVIARGLKANYLDVDLRKQVFSYA